MHVLPYFILSRTCEYLVRTHMERNDKVIIFGDNVFSLKKVNRCLRKEVAYCHVLKLETRLRLHERHCTRFGVHGFRYCRHFLPVPSLSQKGPYARGV